MIWHPIKWAASITAFPVLQGLQRRAVILLVIAEVSQKPILKSLVSETNEDPRKRQTAKFMCQLNCGL